MTNRKTYHVTKHPDGWQGKLPGANRPSVVKVTKEETVKASIELAKGAQLGQVIIHRGDGVIQTEHTYGEDPKKYKG